MDGQGWRFRVGGSLADSTGAVRLRWTGLVADRAGVLRFPRVEPTIRLLDQAYVDLLSMPQAALPITITVTITNVDEPMTTPY